MRNAGFFDESLAGAQARERRRSATLISGVAAGTLAGIAMLAFLMLAAVANDISPARPLALTGAMVAGDGAAALLAGAVIWLLVSAVLGVVFASVVAPDFRFVAAAILGVGYSFLLIAVMSGFVLPRVNPTMRSSIPAMGGSWVLGYMVYGVVLGLAPVLRRRLARRR